jgi:predicted ATP-binding protein involved in virulence
MRIDRIKLQNYRGFAEFEKRFSRRFTLIVGSNGVGKTSLLDAISVAFGAFLLGIPAAKSRTINKSEARETVKNYEGSLDFITIYPVIIEAEGVLFDEGNHKSQDTSTWRRELLSSSGRTTSKNAEKIRAAAKERYELISGGRDVTLPLLSYYGTGRLWMEPKQMGKQPKSSRFDAYKNSHEARVSSADLLAWLERERLLELETEKPSERLSAWKKAVETCFDEPVSISYSPSRKRIEISFKNRENLVVSFDNLSHGQRNVLSMIGDIAFKSIILNPHLGARAVAETHGIILIDEIDLHLHPRWQRIIIPSLLRSFPNLQFFATTHSPFIVQSLTEGSLLNLDTMETDDEVYNLDLMQIVEEIQDVETPQRSAVHLAKVEKAARFLTLSEMNAAEGSVSSDHEKEMGEIIKEIEDPGLAALLKIKQIANRKR